MSLFLFCVCVCVEVVTGRLTSSVPSRLTERGCSVLYSSSIVSSLISPLEASILSRTGELIGVNSLECEERGDKLVLVSTCMVLDSKMRLRAG